MTSEDTFSDIIDVFKEALADDDVEVQMGAIKSLPAMAMALDFDKTKNILLPYLLQNITEVNDEMQICTAEQLIRFISLVGGDEYMDMILQILVKICVTDETLVRDRAVEAIKNLIKNMDSQMCEEFLVPIIHDLAIGEWFTNKCSASALFSSCYSKVEKEEKKKELRDIYRNLTQDESPMVRKAAAINLPGFLEVLEPEHIKLEFVPVLDNVAKDLQDQVKPTAVDIGIAIAKKIEQSDIKDGVFNIMEEFSQDESWKIRHKIATSIHTIQNTLGENKNRGKILKMYQNLAKDGESEVRIVAVKNLFNYCESLKQSYANSDHANNFEPVILESIMPLIKLTLEDGLEEVLLALSNNILNLSSILSPKFYETNVLPNVIDSLESELPIRYKENIIRSLDVLPKEINLSNYMESIKKAIRHLVVDSKLHWRTRRSITIAFIYIGKYTSKEYFDNHLKIYYSQLLDDAIFAVRRTASIVLPLFAEVFGIKWTINSLIQMFMKNSIHQKYLYRYIPLNCINELLYPSIEKGQKFENDKFLDYFKKSTSEKEVKTLARIVFLQDKLSNLLSTDPYMEILNSHCNDDFIEENVQIYAEDTLNILRKERKESVYALKGEIKENEFCYLEGILLLCNVTFLPVLLKLSKDPLMNIQLLTKHTLKKISTLSTALKKEINTTWVHDKIKGLSSEASKEIEDCIENFIKELPLDFCPKSSTEDVKPEAMIITSEKEPLPDLGPEVLNLDVNDTLKTSEVPPTATVTDLDAENGVDIPQSDRPIVGNLEKEIMDALEKPSSI